MKRPVVVTDHDSVAFSNGEPNASRNATGYAKRAVPKGISIPFRGDWNTAKKSNSREILSQQPNVSAVRLCQLDQALFVDDKRVIR